MKNFFSLFAFVGLCFTATSQIQFQDSTLVAALAVAKKANKPLFVDVFATWCGPCKRMAATAFVDTEVSELYNTQFISLTLDGEKNDGPEVMATYQIDAYPTLLYFYPDGTLASKLVGGQDAEGLISAANKVLHPELDPVYMARKNYFSSDLSEKSLRTYMTVLFEAEDDSSEFYAQSYYSKHSNLKLSDPFELNVFMSQENDYLHPLSVEYLANESLSSKEDRIDKISYYIQQSFIAAVATKDFSITENATRYLFPILNRLGAEGLPPVDEFVIYLKSEFDKEE